MITALIRGGLGNQMFQYAMGRALALRRGVPLRLDTRGCRWYGRRLGLQRFRLALVEASLARIPDAVYHRHLCRLDYYERLRPYLWLHPCVWFHWLSSRTLRAVNVYGPGPLLHREHTFSFDPLMLDAPDGSFVAGFWQCERYFADAANTIRRDFVLRDPPSPENHRWLDRIRAADCAVSVHVRQGADYRASDVLGVCSPAYYREAARLVEQRTGRKPVFFVFSDEPARVREQLRLDREVHVIDHNDTEGQAHDDMRLMAACDHHVIANSTFSWWGAWLNPSPDKVVVAPEPWMRDPEIDTRDILPPGWLTVPSRVRDAAG